MSEACPDVTFETDLGEGRMLRWGHTRAYARAALWPEPLGWCLTDIVVPFQLQGRGHGRDLLRRVTDWADQQGVDLCLSPVPCGGWMDYDQLVSWYQRHGFSWTEGILRRGANVTYGRSPVAIEGGGGGCTTRSRA